MGGGGWLRIQIDNYGIRMVGAGEFVILFSLFLYMFENLHATKKFKVLKPIFLSTILVSSVIYITINL